MLFSNSGETDFNQAAWRHAAARRIKWSRLLSFFLVGSTSAATYYFLVMYGYSYWIIIPFIVAYFSLGYLGMTYFVGMWFGFFVSLRDIEKDPYHPIHRAKDIEEGTRIAVLLPVYHEDPRRFAAGLGAMWEDLKKHPESHAFDFFILSDSRKANNVVQEEWVVYLLAEKYPDGRFIYRHRSVNSFAKLGNIADFLRRWGNHYKYMIMLDADSVMPADSMIKMAKIMEGGPKIGIIQAHLSMVFRKTIYARISRFISAFTLKIGFYGQYYFYLGQGYYYGHNAIIRVDAFVEHCGLPILEKRGPWAAGKPLSHDYVEAALMEGAGYEIWSLPEIDSFEELPTNLIDDMQREMRWMYGSLIYLRVFMISRISSLYKVRLFTSAINYINPLLGWVFFLMGIFGLRYIFENPIKSGLLIEQYRPIFIFSLAFLTFSIIAKMALPIIYHMKMRTTHHFGGLGKMIASYIVYFFYSLAMGPIYMAQFTRMIYHWLRGEKMHWGEQNRDDRSLSWRESMRHFWWMSALGVVLGWLVIDYVFSIDTAYVQRILNLPKWDLMFWYIPLLFGLVTSPWLVRFLSKEIDIVEKMGWFKSPQEVEPHFVLEKTQELINFFSDLVPEDTDLGDAIHSPWFYLRHRATCFDRPRKFGFWWNSLKDKDLSDLSEGEKRIILSERGLLDKFHHASWQRLQ